MAAIRKFCTIALVTLTALGLTSALATVAVAAVHRGPSASATSAGPAPKVTATVASSAGKSKYGWYRTPLTITYSCNSEVSSCPQPLRIHHSGRHITVARTSHNNDGTRTTVKSGPFKVDLDKPSVTIELRSSNEVACSASDGLSGLQSLNCVHHRVKHGVRWTAIAKDKAGNVSRKSLVVRDT